MLWILLDVAIALAALAVLAVLVLGLWRQVKDLMSVVTAAGETITSATDALTAASADGLPGGPAAEHSRPPGR